MAASTAVFAAFTASFILLIDCAINVDELNSMTYHVDILNRPVMSSQEPSSSIMYMTSKYGQEYQCQLPEIPQFQEDGKIIDESSTVSPLSDISNLLQPLETKSCLIKTKDWWTYEFCYGKYIKQYHLEDNKIVDAVILLGIYESEFNWKNETLEFESNKNKIQRYHSQFYVNGSKCDVTGTLRKTEVRFVCDEGGGDYIAQVDEPESCRYVILIHTNKVCNHPFLRPPPTNKPRSITCNPILTSEQYEVFQKREEEEKKVIEERQRKWLAKQEEELLAIKQQDQESTKAAGESLEKDTSDAITAEDVDDKQKSAQENDEEGGYMERIAGAVVVEDLDRESGDGEDVEFSESSELSKLTRKLQNLEHDLDNQLVEHLARLNKNYDQDTSVNVETETFSKLAETLVNLLEQLNKAEKDLTTANEALWELQKTIAKVKPEEDSESTREKPGEVVTQKSGLQMEPVTEESDDKKTTSAYQVPDDIKLEFNKLAPQILKALKLKKDESSKVSTEIESEQDVPDDNNVAVIEQEVIDRLKRMGIDTEGRQVEVKIFTAGYFVDYDEYNLINDGDGNKFHTVVVKLGGHNEATASHTRHQNSLEKNYRFVWDESQTIVDDDESENDNYKNA